MLRHRIVGIVLMTLIAFVLSVAGVLLWFSWLLGLTGFLFWRLLDPDFRDPRGWEHTTVTVSAGGVVAVVAAVPLIGGSPGRDILGVIIATLVAGACYYLAARQRIPICTGCGGAAIEGVECPRCGDRACTSPQCWNAKYARCIRCLDNGIVLFPMSRESWWSERFGARVLKGTCSFCMKEAHEADLRACGQCSWPMCKQCWDHHNGACQQCDWQAPDLPRQLIPFLRRRGIAARRGHGGS